MRFDVHAGAFETATMREIYPEAVREKCTCHVRTNISAGRTDWQMVQWSSRGQGAYSKRICRRSKKAANILRQI